MITKERFIELMNQDGIKTKIADRLWEERMKERFEGVYADIPDEENEAIIHQTNLIMLPFTPPGYLLSSGN